MGRERRSAPDPMTYDATGTTAGATATPTLHRWAGTLNPSHSEALTLTSKIAASPDQRWKPHERGASDHSGCRAATALAASSPLRRIEASTATEACGRQW
jgi:hypothetical protein